jgi:hypothetical protein
MITGAFFQTTAPKAYDAFGTVTISEDWDNKRIVFIHAEHQKWQIDRYASGMHGALLVPAFLESRL